MSTTAILRHRRDTAANWTAANPVLPAGQLAFETDTRKSKLGDGVTAWNSLSYTTAAATTAWGGITGTLSSQTDLQTALNGKAASSHTHVTADITNLSSYTGFDARYYTETEVDTALAGKENTGVAAAAVATHEGLADPHPQYLTAAEGNAAYAALGHNHTGTYQPLDTDLTDIAALTANGFLKRTAGVWGMDNSTYLTGNQTITLSGDASGSGTTAITVSIASFAGSTKGLVPASVGGTTNFLRADGTWAAPPGGAGISDGDKGDITVTASGATWTIDAQAVSYSKIQNVTATDKLLGRATAGAGTIEEITCTAAGRALIDDVSASAQRSTLGLGNLATLSFVDDTRWDSAGTPLQIGNGGTAATDAATARTNLGLGTAATQNSTAFEVPLTFSTGLTRSTNTVTVNTSQNISTLSNLTLNGFVKTSGGTGALSVDTTSYSAVGHPHVSTDITDWNEAVDDRVAALLVAGSNVTLTYNDASNTLTIASTGGGGGLTEAQYFARTLLRLL